MLRQIKWRVQNELYHKERVFAGNYFIVLKILFQFKNLLQRIDLMYQRTKRLYSCFL